MSTRVPGEIAEFNTNCVSTNNRLLATNTVTAKKYWEAYGWTTVLSSGYKSDRSDKLVTAIGRGKFEIHVRADTDSYRASVTRDAGAGSVQYASSGIAGPEDTEANPGSLLLTKDISGLAHFEFDAGAPKQAKWPVIYFRR